MMDAVPHDPVVDHFDGKVHVVTDDVLLKLIDCQKTSVRTTRFRISVEQ